MIRVGICDEEEKYRKQTADILFRVLFDVEDIHFTFYESGEHLIENILEGKFHQDLLIMDPVFRNPGGGVNGLRILEFLRRQEMQTEVILQTEAIEIAQYGYRLHIFDFIPKPVSVQCIEQVINRFIRERLQYDEGFLNIFIQGCQQRLRLGKVLYFESQARKIMAVMLDETVEFYQKMDELWEKIQKRGFLRCHQSYIVNKDYVTGMISGELQLFNRKTLPVSRAYAKQVREALLEEKKK